MYRLNHSIRLCSIVVLLGLTACSVSNAVTSPAATGGPAIASVTAGATDSTVILGARPNEVCEPRVDRVSVERLNTPSATHDPRVSERIKALRDADQAHRAGAGLPGGGKPDSLPAGGVTRVAPRSGQSMAPQGQPTLSADEKKKMEAEFRKFELEDKQRRVEVMGYLREGKISAADDLAAAALIFQHGKCLDHFALAHMLAAKAVAQGSATARPLYALTLDRYLVSLGKPQKFGTQYVPVTGQAGRCALAPVDPTTTDEERKKYNVKTLAEARAWATSGNVICV